jgi:hypothetical protein
MNTSNIPFAPLTDRELLDRSRSHAFMTAGALDAWAKSDSPYRQPEPSVAIEHAALVIAYQNAIEIRWANR